MGSIATETIGERIRRLRAGAEISQRELAARTDLSPAYLSRIESGDRRPSRRALEAIASALAIPGVTALYLESGEGAHICPHCGSHVTI